MTLSSAAPTPMSAARLAMLSPGIDALTHSTLPLVERYHKRTLLIKSPAVDTDTASSKVPAYKPRSSSPVTEASFAMYNTDPPPTIQPLNASEQLLLQTLTAENERRTASEQRLKSHVNSLVRDWNEKRARVEEEACRIMEQERIERAEQVRLRLQTKLAATKPSDSKTSGQQQTWTLPASATVPVTITITSTSATSASANKAQLNDNLFQSDLSLPVTDPTLAEIQSFVTGTNVYIGNALSASFSPFQHGTVEVTEKAKSMLSNDIVTSSGDSSSDSIINPQSSSLDTVDKAWYDAACGKVTSHRPQSQPLQAEAQRHRALHSEVEAVKARLIASGVYVNQGTIERALGLDRHYHRLSTLQQAGSTTLAGIGPNGGSWPIPFSTLVDNPSEKKKKASTEKKASKKTSKGKK